MSFEVNGQMKKPRSYFWARPEKQVSMTINSALSIKMLKKGSANKVQPKNICKALSKMLQEIFKTSAKLCL